MTQTLVIVFALFLGISTLPFVYAQNLEGAQQANGGESLTEVGAQLANPVSSVWSIVFQNNYTFLEGDPSESRL